MHNFLGEIIVKTTVLAMGMVMALLGAQASAGSLADPVVAPQVVAADAVANSNEEMHQMLALLTMTVIVTTVMATLR